MKTPLDNAGKELETKHRYPFEPMHHELESICDHWYEHLFAAQWRAMAFPDVDYSWMKFIEERINEIRDLIGEKDVTQIKEDVEERWEQRMPTLFRILRDGTDKERDLVRWLASQHPERPAEDDLDIQGGPLFELEEATEAFLNIRMEVPSQEPKQRNER